MSLTIQGLLVAALSLFIDNTELASSLATDIVLVLGIVMAWVGRYRQGNIDVMGFRK